MVQHRRGSLPAPSLPNVRNLAIAVPDPARLRSANSGAHFQLLDAVRLMIKKQREAMRKKRNYEKECQMMCCVPRDFWLSPVRNEMFDYFWSSAYVTRRDVARPRRLCGSFLIMIHNGWFMSDPCHGHSLNSSMDNFYRMLSNAGLQFRPLRIVRDPESARYQMAYRPVIVLRT